MISGYVNLARATFTCTPTDDYDFSFQPELDPRKVKDLATLPFVEAKANAALLGPPGVGKTHKVLPDVRSGPLVWLATGSSIPTAELISRSGS